MPRGGSSALQAATPLELEVDVAPCAVLVDVAPEDEPPLLALPVGKSLVALTVTSTSITPASNSLRRRRRCRPRYPRGVLA